MARIPEDWNKAQRNGKGGALVYINGDELIRALQGAGLPEDLKDIEVRAYGAKKSRKGMGRIILTIRKKKQVSEKEIIDQEWVKPVKETDY
jgi:hypothetical protein